jgi:hypothetical protein
MNETPRTLDDAPPPGPAAVRSIMAAIHNAEARALAAHQAGTCRLSEWSCSHCEASGATTTETA